MGPMRCDLLLTTVVLPVLSLGMMGCDVDIDVRVDDGDGEGEGEGEG